MSVRSISEINRDVLQALAADHLTELVYLTDLSGSAREVLPSVVQRLGYEPDEFLTAYPSIVRPESEVNRELPELRRQHMAGASHAEAMPVYCQEFVRKDGLPAVFEIREVLLREAGQPVASLCIGHDVTDYHRQLAELQDSNQGLMVVHHTQQLLMNAHGRRELLHIALDAPINLIGIPQGALFDLSPGSMCDCLIGARGLSAQAQQAVSGFCLSERGNPEQFQHGKDSTALLFSPGHSWLAPLEPIMGANVLGLLLVCKGEPHAFAVFGGDGVALSREKRRLLQSVGNLVVHALEDVVLHETLDRLRFTDARTGLYTRGYIDDFLAREERLIRRHGRTASVVLMSLVPMHEPPTEEESQSLVTMARALRARVRATDLLSSYGGSEFLFYLPETNHEGAQKLVDRCRALFTDLLHDGGSGAQLFLAVGSATSERGQSSLREILDQAREEMEGQRAALTQAT